MPSYRILYFTGTGNTAYVAQELFKKLKAQAKQVEILAVDELWAACGRSLTATADSDLVKTKLQEFISSAQVVIVLYPVYASTIPQPLQDLLPLFPKVSGVKLVSIAVCALTGGDCCYLLHQELQSLGYESLLALEVKMPSNMTFPYLKQPSIKNGEALQEFYQQVAGALDDVVAKIIAERKILQGRGILARGLGILQRIMKKLFGKYLSDHMFATDACIKCKRCVLSCPMANIQFDNLPRFGQHCCLCMRCYNFCPGCAIQVTKKTLDTKVYIRYRGFNHWVPPRLF